MKSEGRVKVPQLTFTCNIDCNTACYRPKVKVKAEISNRKEIDERTDKAEKKQHQAQQLQSCSTVAAVVVAGVMSVIAWMLAAIQLSEVEGNNRDGCKYDNKDNKNNLGWRCVILHRSAFGLKIIEKSDQKIIRTIQIEYHGIKRCGAFLCTSIGVPAHIILYFLSYLVLHVVPAYVLVHVRHRVGFCVLMSSRVLGKTV